MNGYEMLVREFDALKEEIMKLRATAATLWYNSIELGKENRELKKQVELLMRERQEKIDFDIACMKTLKEWEEYNKAEAAADAK